MASKLELEGDIDIYWAAEEEGVSIGQKLSGSSILSGVGPEGPVETSHGGLQD